MIKVLIVEDDKLVRKSLISSFEWGKFDMKIIGDAKNGEKAVEFVKKHAVDLIITDLAMPIMSGIELIRIVKEMNPKIAIVVLSLHRDFEYIQEAMRLGAIDYIAKIELDGNNMDDILYRIQQQIDKESNATEEKIEDGYAFISENSATCKLVLQDFIEESEMSSINDTSFLVKSNQYSAKELVRILMESKRLIRPLLCITPRTEQEFIEMKRLIKKQSDQLLFYELHQDKQLTIVEFQQLQPVSHIPSNQLSNWKPQLRSLEWVSDQDTFNEMLQTFKKIYMEKEQLIALLSWALNDWKRMYGDILPMDLHIPEGFSYWQDVESWFYTTRLKIYQAVFSPSFSIETNQCIIKAISIIENELASSLTAQNVANKVNMSRSYFSRCFKEIVGHTFNEYVRMARMNKSKHYLLYSSKKIGVIAEKVGYTDIKYFSKLFRRATGLLPSEYRKINKKGVK